VDAVDAQGTGARGSHSGAFNPVTHRRRIDPDVLTMEAVRETFADPRMQDVWRSNKPRGMEMRMMSEMAGKVMKLLGGPRRSRNRSRNRSRARPHKRR
jgi:hypothetical protein